MLTPNARLCPAVLLLVSFVSTPLTADVIALHSGSADPTSEGWTALPGPGGGVSVGPIHDGGIAAWYVDDDSTAAGSIFFYQRAVDATDRADGTANGWTLSTTIRVASDEETGYDGSPSVGYRDGSRGWEMEIGLNGEGDTFVRLYTGATTGPVYTLSGNSGFSTFSLRYDPLASSADLFLDGTEIISDYGGFPSSETVVLWGAGRSPDRGQGNFSHVSFAVAVDTTCTVTFRHGTHGALAGGTPDVVVTVAYGAAAPAAPAVSPDYGWLFSGWSPALPATITADVETTAQYGVAGPAAPAGDFLAVVDETAVAAGKGWWNLSGNYATAIGGNPLVLHLVHDTKGKLSGEATYTVAKETAVTAPVKGTAKGSAGALAAKIALKGANEDKTASVALTLNLTLDAANRQLVGTMDGSVTVAGASVPVATPVTLPIPAPMDGTWTLLCHLVQGAKGITGTATLTLSNGDDFLYAVKGRVAGDTVALSLKADATDPAAKGIKTKTTITPLEGGWARLETFGGRACGQTVAW